MALEAYAYVFFLYHNGFLWDNLILLGLRTLPVVDLVGKLHSPVKYKCLQLYQKEVYTTC